MRAARSEAEEIIATALKLSRRLHRGATMFDDACPRSCGGEDCTCDANGWVAMRQKDALDLLATDAQVHGIYADDQFRPCPFCGGTRNILNRVEHAPGADVPDDDPEKWDYFVSCAGCASQGPWSKTSREAAIRLWNGAMVTSPATRPDPAKS